MPYKLSASLSEHSSDVRAVVSPSNDLVLSASRDKTARSWTRTSSNAFSQDFTFRAGNKFLNAITYIPPSSEAPRGYMATGGNEAVINVYPLDAPSDEPRYALVGHADNVCTLNTSPSGLLISGSWDRTARVWRNFQQVYELKGHEQSVWAALILDEAEDIFLTGSADKTIRLWMKHKLIRTFSGHTQAVRGLALIPHIGFASCSNDGEIRVWTTEGDVVSTLSGHTSFVYSLTVLPTGEIASGGEDRTLRIWRDEECIQTIVHPATSVWTVSSMLNGDIVTGSSDGVVRIFSNAEERWASSNELKEYDELVASQALPSQQVGDVKKTDLPGLEALTAPGKKPGEVKMVRNGDRVEAHQESIFSWDSASMTWQKIGDVVDAVGSGRKQLYEGKEYDYVFDVDIQDGVPPLKLPYNANENPFTAAQRFLASHDLPMSYLDQVVQFIQQNTSGVSLSTTSEYSDPFTGASRYQGGGSSGPAASPAYADPFTGATRYQPPTISTPSAPSSGYGDPLTGGSRYAPPTAVPPPQTVTPARSTSVVPVSTFLSFKQGNVNAMRGKVSELDDGFRNEISTTAVAIYGPEAERLDEAYAYLNQALTSPGKITAPPLDKAHLEAVEQILERWPSSSRFPIIDLARLISGNCPSAYTDSKVAQQFFASLLKAAEWDAPWDGQIPKSRETNMLLTLRALVNSVNESTPVGLGDWVGAILGELARAPYDALAKNHRVALATFLFNISCIRLKGPIESSSIGEQHLSLISMILHQEQKDGETAYRALVALGNTLFALKAQSISLAPGQVSEFRQALPGLRSRFLEDRTSAVIKDVETLLSS
ncbi:LUB1 [Sanghuangporus sanghuang]